MGEGHISYEDWMKTILNLRARIAVARATLNTSTPTISNPPKVIEEQPIKKAESKEYKMHEDMKAKLRGKK